MFGIPRFRICRQVFTLELLAYLPPSNKLCAYGMQATPSLQTTVMEPIGTIIREELMRQERSISWFARKLSCDRSNVYRLFQKHSIDTALLQRISVILNRDFFAELSRNLPSNRDRQDL